MIKATRFGIFSMGLFWALALALADGCEKKTQPSAAAEPAPAAQTVKLTVLAAASLADAFREIGAAYEGANPGAKVEFSFAGSNQLRTQLENGGPGDVFASADRKQMDAAAASKVVDGATVRVFAWNWLAIISPRENRAGIKELADLARPGLKIVAADKAVPVGNYTRLMLEKAGATDLEKDRLGPAFVKAFEANVVSREESVAALVAKIALNEADAGIAYASDAAGSNGPKLTVLALPPGLDQKAEYVVAVTARARDAKAAAKFVDFLVSKQAQGMLEKRGFMSAEVASGSGVGGAGTP